MKPNVPQLDTEPSQQPVPPVISPPPTNNLTESNSAQPYPTSNTPLSSSVVQQPIPTAPPSSPFAEVDENNKNKSRIKNIGIVLMAILFIGGLAYFFYNRNRSTNNPVSNTQPSEEQPVATGWATGKYKKFENDCYSIELDQVYSKSSPTESNQCRLDFLRIGGAPDVTIGLFATEPALASPEDFYSMMESSYKQMADDVKITEKVFVSGTYPARIDTIQTAGDTIIQASIFTGSAGDHFASNEAIRRFDGVTVAVVSDVQGKKSDSISTMLVNAVKSLKIK